MPVLQDKVLGVDRGLLPCLSALLTPQGEQLPFLYANCVNRQVSLPRISKCRIEAVETAYQQWGGKPKEAISVRIAANIIVSLIVIAMLAAGTACAAGQFTLQAFKITANAPVQITLPPNQPVKQPTYVTAAGEWKQLQVDKSEAGLAFSLPTDAIGSTVILLSKPDWLTLPDTDAPTIEAASVAGVAVTPIEDTMTVGHLDETPKNLMFTVADATNPISARHIKVLLNGQPVSSTGGSLKIDQSPDGKHADIIITPGDLPKDKHNIMLIIPDATPARNTLIARLTFTTAPLLRDGGFEELDDKGKPKHWSFGSWHSGEASDYKISIAKGEGRSGNALKFVGITGRLNMVVGQPVDLVPGRTYILSGYSKGDCNGGYASLIGKAVGDAKAQYDNTSPCKQADDWTPFSWEITPAESNKNFIIYLRSTSKGTVYMDDIKLQAKQ